MGCLVSIGVIVVLSITLSIRFSFGNDNSAGYAPTDTRLVSYSSTFCEGLTLISETGHSQSTGKMYLLSETPQLNANESFSITEDIIISSYGDYQYWNFYLHPGSNFLLSVCYNDDSSGHFTYVYLIKGTKNFNIWKDNADSDKSFHYFLLAASYSCSSNNKRTYSFNVANDNEYYFVFYSSHFSSDHVSVQIDFYRTKYTIPDSSVLDNCSLQLDGSSTCSIDTPYSPQRTALLVLDTTADPIQWDTNVDISVSCSTRAWPYVVISLSIISFVVLLVVGVVMAIVCVRRHKKKKYAPLVDSNTSATSTTTTTTATVTATVFDPKPQSNPPPPFNPSYGTTTAPPAYTP